MNILLVNDDGIDSKRLQFAKEELEKIADVWVVAPKQGMSGASMSITVGEMNFEQIGEQVYVVDGTPVDCYLFAKYALKLNPDWVVSGVNYGWNIGLDIQYSGTYAVAKRATFDNINAVAFSAGLHGEKTMKKYFLEIFDFILENHPNDLFYVTNINFPDDNLKYNGKKFVTPSYEDLSVSGEIRKDVFQIKRMSFNDKQGHKEENEIWALSKGYISISRIRFNRFTMF